MPIWQSSMRWSSDGMADGDAWQKALIYLGFLVVLVGVVGLIALAFRAG